MIGNQLGCFTNETLSPFQLKFGKEYKNKTEGNND